jgi:hypothetical protein
LLQAVMDARMPEVRAVMDQCGQATSLKEALLVFSTNFAERAPGTRWILMELPHLSEEERTVILEKFAALRGGLADTIRKFVSDETQADHIAWLMVCIGAGYQQLFAETAFRGRVDLPMPTLMETFIDLMA